MINFIISLICAYIACIGFGLIFNLRGKLLFISSIGGDLIVRVKGARIAISREMAAKIMV